MQNQQDCDRGQNLLWRLEPKRKYRSHYVTQGNTLQHTEDSEFMKPHLIVLPQGQVRILPCRIERKGMKTKADHEYSEPSLEHLCQ